MHPLFRNWRRWLVVYLLAWAAIAAALAGLLRSSSVGDWRAAFLVSGPLCLFLAFDCLTPWYMCRILSLGKTPAMKLTVNHGGAAILATTIGLLISRGIASQLADGIKWETAAPMLIALCVLLYSLSVALHYVFLAVEESKHAAIQARDAELRALKSQINPHFLFNCLNSISALASVDAGRARDMCIKLGGFLRNTLGLGEKQSIPWSEELGLAQSYLDIEQVRFGSRLRVEMNVDPGCSDCAVPPLLLQPLIENAVKHGIASMIEGGTIEIESHFDAGKLFVSVENGYDPESPATMRGGLGLRNVKSRLETRFGSAATLAIRKESSRFRAELVMPCQKL